MNVFICGAQTKTYSLFENFDETSEIQQVIEKNNLDISVDEYSELASSLIEAVKSNLEENNILRPDLLQFTIREQFNSIRKVDVNISSDYFSPINREFEEIMFSQLEDVSDIINLTYNIYIDKEINLQDITNENKEEILILKYLSENFPQEFITLRAALTDFKNLKMTDLSPSAFEGLSLYLDSKEIIESVPIYSQREQTEDLILINGYPYSKLIFVDDCPWPESGLDEDECPKYFYAGTYFPGCVYDCVGDPAIYTAIAITITGCLGASSFFGPAAPPAFLICLSAGIVGIGGSRALFCANRCARDPFYYYRDENCPKCYHCVPGEERNKHECEKNCVVIERCNAYGTTYKNCIYSVPCPDGTKCMFGICIPEEECPPEVVVENEKEECDLSINIFPRNNTNPPNQASNGGLGVLVGGGQYPYTWEWSDGSGSGFSRTRLPAGTYCITVYDASENCCIAVDCATIYNDYEEPCQLGLESITIELESKSACDGNNGFVFSSVEGGNPPYLYSWSNGGTKSALQNQPPGPYTLTVTDGSGCTAEAYGFIGGPMDEIEPELLLLDSKDICGSSLGMLSVFLYTSTPITSYSWSNGASGSEITDLSAGNYTVTITDECANEYIKSFKVSETPAVSLSGVVNPSCNGGNNGVINLTIHGGQKPMSTEWSNGSTGVDQFTLAGGLYSVTVTDYCGQTATSSYLIPSSTAIQANISSLPSCTNNGSISISNVSGGVPPYSYKWNTGSNSASLNNLEAGTYCVTISDSNGCSSFKCGEVLLGQLSVSVTSTNFEDCIEEGGGVHYVGQASAMLSIVGSGNYSINWRHGNDIVSTQNSVIPNLEGYYSYTVLDQNGCEATGGVEICCCSVSNVGLLNNLSQCDNGDGLLINISFNVIGLNTAIGTTGEVNATVSNALVGASYIWTGPNGFIFTGLNLTNITDPGVYTLTVKDGCSQESKSVIIADCGTSEIDFGGSIDNTCSGYSAGSIFLNPSGGGSGYSAIWSNGANTNSISSLSVGTYTVTVTSDGGCSASESFEINEMPVVEVPNWQECRVDLECNGEVVGAGANGQITSVSDPFDCRKTITTCFLPGFGNEITPSTAIGSFSDFQVTVSDNKCIYEGKCPLSSGASGNSWQEIASGVVKENKDYGECSDKEGTYYCEKEEFCELNTIFLTGVPLATVGSKIKIDKTAYCPSTAESLGKCNQNGASWVNITPPGGGTTSCSLPSGGEGCMQALACLCDNENFADFEECRECVMLNRGDGREIFVEGINNYVFESRIIENPIKSEIILKVTPGKYSHLFNFRVTGADGGIVWSAENIQIHSTELLKIPLVTQSSGIYFVQIYDGFHQITQKVIKLP